MKEFVIAVEEVEREADGVAVEDQYVEFEMVDHDAEGNETGRRTLRAYHPTDGQLAFMLAAMGRGQSDDQRFAAIVNIMLSSMRNADRDYLEGRLLSRDPKQRLPMKHVEAMFEYLTEEWFARPTQPSSDSGDSPPHDGQN